MKQLLRFKTFLLMAVLSILAGTSAWAQSDYSDMYTSNVALPSSGTNVSSCKVVINGTQYDGTKLGKSKTGASASITVPAGTKYIHLHVAAWNGKTPGFSYTVGSGTAQTISGITSDTGIANNSPFTFSGDPSSTDYYKVITLESALTAETSITLACTSERVVFWGVNTEEESGSGGDTSVATTVTIDASGITNTDVYAGTDAGSLTATVSTDEGAISGAIVTWSGNNDAVATIDASTGAVTLVAAGSVTFTASYAGVENTYKPSSKTYVMTVTNNDPTIPGTENNPYTVAQARAAIDAGTGLTGVYATGIVSAIPTAYNSQYSNITFNFVDNDGDTDFLQAYRCGGTDAADVQVGDIVVVYGNLTKYGSTYEFGQGCEVVSVTHPAVAVAAPTFSPAVGAYTEPQNVTISCATDGADIYYTTDGTEPDVNSTPYTGAINVATTTTIKAIAYKGGESSTVAKATYHITSVDNPYTVSQALGFDDSEYPIEQIYVHGIVSTAPTQAPTSYGQLTYYISDDGTTTNQLQVYKGQGLNAVEFTSQDDIQVGDEVTIIGNVKIYNNAKEFDTGNYLVAFNRPVVATPSITITPDTYEMDAKAGGGVLPVVCENLASDPQLAVVFVESDGVTPATYDWISATINADGNIDGQITANDTGAARTAYFKVSGKAADGSTVYSNLVTFTQQAAATEPYITVNTGVWDVDANGGSKTFGFDHENLGSNPTFELQFFESDGTTETQCGWITYQFDSNDNKVTINALNNDEGAARTVYFKVYAEVNKTTIYSNLVTVNQAAPAVPATGDYVKVTTDADLTDGEYLIVYEDGNLAFDGNLTTLDAASNTVAVTIDNNTIASTTAVDAATFTIDVTAGTIQSASGYYIGQTSDANGLKASNTEAYTNTMSIDADGNAVILASGGAYLRYNATSGQERFRYFKSSTYSSQKAIALYKKSSSPAPTTPSITLPGGYDYTMDAKAGGGELPVTCSNMPADPKLEVLFYESDGTTSATYTWISAYINSNGNIYGQIQENTGAARTAYFKVHGVDADKNDVYSNLVTFTQEAPVAATPTIVFNPESIDFDSNGGSKTIGGDYFLCEDFDSTPSLEILYYESDGDTEKQGGYDWLTADFNSNNQIDFTWGTNTGAARSAYLKIHAVGTTVYSNLFTINQAAPATDYVTLPFNWAGGVKADLTALDGVSANGLDSDYADSHAPYRVKFDSDGDYIQFKTNEQPGVVTIGVKMIGGGNTSTITVQGSADGDKFTDIEELTISGKQNDIVNLETTTSFAATDRYVRLTFTKGSNVGVGPITIAKYVATPSITITPATVNAKANDNGGELTVTCENLAATPNLQIVFVESDGETAATYNWISAEFNSNGNIDGILQPNTGDARTAYLVVTGVDADNNVVKSNLVTINQAAPAAPSITVEKGSIDFVAGGESDRKMSFEYESLGNSPSFEVVFFDELGTTVTTYDWVTTATIENNEKVNLSVAQNDGAARTAYFKVHETATDVYSILVTINQEAAGTAAKGTLSNPYTVAEVKALNISSAMADKWVVGYIAGSYKSDNATDATSVASNIALTDDGSNLAGEYLPVQLSNGTTYRTVLNVKDTEGNIGLKVMVKGSLEAYFGTNGVKSLSDARIINTISSVGYSTMYFGQTALKIETEGVTAKTYTINNGALAEGDVYEPAILDHNNYVIPAGTAVVLEGAAGEYQFSLYTSDAEAPANNALRGFDTAAETTGPDAGDYLFYLLGVGTGNKVGFYWGADKGAAFTSGAHKAYLAVPAEKAGDVRAFYFDGTTTGIDALNLNIEGNDAYDLQGRRVQQVQKGGLYIINGKKMLAK